VNSDCDKNRILAPRYNTKIISHNSTMPDFERIFFISIRHRKKLGYDLLHPDRYSGSPNQNIFRDQG